MKSLFQDSEAEDIDIALALKLLGIEPVLNDGSWQIIKNRLETVAEKLMSKERHESSFGIPHYFNMASKMKMLAAEDIKITDKGIEIKMPENKEPLQSETLSMPEVRNF